MDAITQGAIDRIREALSYIPADDRDTWLRVGMAVKSEIDDGGFDLWDEWSQKGESYNAKDARTVWKSITPDGGVTIATLYHEAKAHGWRGDGTHQKPTPEELAERRRIAAERAAKEEAEIARERAEAASNAAAIWQAATPAGDDYPYLVRKGVKAYGLRLYRGDLEIAGMPCDSCLIVPARDGSGVIHTLQFIHPEHRDGDNKRFLCGGATSGYYHGIAQPDGVLCIAEGFATAATIHEATGHAVAVVFTAGNLLAVAKALRAKYPNLRLILCADDDRQTEGNPGLTKATEAALAIGGLLAIPDFGTDRPDGAKDFNDMTVLCGAEAVERAIANATTPMRREENPPAVETIAEVIKRLSHLHTVEYESARIVEAKKLGWRRSALDDAVNKARLEVRQEKRAECLAKEALPCPKLKHDVITMVDSAFKASGYGGETQLPMLIYLCSTTRLLSFAKGKMLGHAQVIGAPSSGKNFALDKVLGLLPEDACLRIDAGTPKALIYSDEELAHRIVFFAEADSLPISEGARGLADGDSRSTAASALRSLASDGCLSFDVVERGDDGKFVTRHIHKDGPTLLLTTAVKSIGGQMGTRLWEIPIKESDPQITAALFAGIQSDDAATGTASHNELVDYQAYLQSKAPWNVRVPFAGELAEGLVHKGMNPRILRDFQRILSLVRAVAVLRHQARETDGDGRLIATLDDYQTVFDVLCESYEATVNDGLTKDVRAVIAAVGKMRHECLAGVTYNDLSTELGWHRDKASRKAGVALRHGWLVNKQEKRRQAAILDIGAEAPESRGLPTREKIQRALSRQKPYVRAYLNAGAASGVRTPNARAAHNADDTQGGAHVTGGTHYVRNDGTHAKPNENATYARTQPFRGGISGSVLEGVNADDNAGNADGVHDMAEDVL